MQQPQEGDIVLVIKPAGLGSASKLGRVTKVGKTTVGVKFANKHYNTYSMETVVFMYRNSKET